MKINPIEKLKRSIRSASLISKILFIFCCIFALLWLISSPVPSVNIWFILTGLFGVLWLSSIVLHSFKHGRMGKYNPFTFLIAACALVSACCLMTRAVWNPDYSSADEPFNAYSAYARKDLENVDAEEFIRNLQKEGEGVFGFHVGIFNTPSNMILTDENNKVLHNANSWATGECETLRALVCPATYESGTGLMILINEKEEVVGAFQLDDTYFGNEPYPRGSSALTITEKTDDPRASRTNNESADPLYDRYFPSFGNAIDGAAIRLAKNGMIVETGEVSGEVIRTERVTVDGWDGQKVSEIPGYSQEDSGLIVSELNALTETERESFKEYIAWLSSAMDAAQTGDGDSNHPYRARIISRGDGKINMLLLYRYDSAALYPLRARHYQQMALRENINYLGLLMIPAVIVFLAFWVFVDAKKRGQSAPALWAVLTLIGNVVTWIVYMLVRPQMMKTAAGQPMPKDSCPICGTKLKNDFIACPGCGILLRSRCKNCGKALENDWSFCPYCTTAVVKEIAAAEEDAETAEE